MRIKRFFFPYMLAFIFLINAIVLPEARAIDKIYKTLHFSLITNYKTDVPSLSFNITGTMGGGSGGIGNHNQDDNELMINMLCLSDPTLTCGLGILQATIQLSLPNGSEKTVCNYLYNYYSHTGKFLVNKPFTPKGSDKPVQCYAVITRTNHVYLLIVDQKPKISL